MVMLLWLVAVVGWFLALCFALAWWHARGNNAVLSDCLSHVVHWELLPDAERRHHILRAVRTVVEKEVANGPRRRR